MKKEIIIWKFQSKAEYFGFVIPDERWYWWWDFFVHKNNFNWAKDGDKVEANLLEKSEWKKPEVKIIWIYKWKAKINVREIKKIVEGIYSWWDGNFWFIDIQWKEKGYFVYGKKKNWAIDWDLVKAEIVDFNWKEEAIVIEILDKKEELLEWVYRDNGKFWFVIPDGNNKSWDIFIAWSRKLEAQNLDRVEVKIIKKWGKNPEGIIKKIL